MAGRVTSFRHPVFFMRSLAIICAALIPMIAAAQAPALVIEPPVYNGSTITGPTDGSPAFGELGTSSGGNLAFDDQSGSLYVASASRIYKFDAATGQSTQFSALGASFIDSQYVETCCGDISVDNTGTGSQGRIYAFSEQRANNAYLPSGQKDSGFNIPSGGYCGSAVGPDGNYWNNQWQANLSEHLPTGVPTGTVFTFNAFGTTAQNGCHFSIDSGGNFYMTTGWQTSEPSYVEKYTSTGAFEYRLGSGTAYSIAVDPSNDNVYIDERDRVEMYSSGGSLLSTFGTAVGPYPGLSESGGLTVDGKTHTVYVSSPSRGIDVFAPGPPVIAADVTTDAVVPAPTAATLKGRVNPSGVKTTDCHFEWGLSSDAGYPNSQPCGEGDELEGSFEIPVTAEISGLTKGTNYKVRLVVENTNGISINGANRAFRAQGAPIVVGQFVDGVKGDVVRLNAEVDPDYGDTTYHFEYGKGSSYGTTIPIPDKALASNTGVQPVAQLIFNLELDTEYHYRVVATDAAGTTIGADRTFRTYPPFNNTDLCPNALERQQTGAVLLGDCRAYELVSASNSGGYNVESDLIPSQGPLPGFPNAAGKVLYGVHDGGIPNTGSPTNKGVDPYVATRGADGIWTTRYVGIPADGTPSSAPFASTFLDADRSLDDIAFSGPNLCSPCFADGSSGIPLRLADGQLVQGLKGSIGQPLATPAGTVKQHFAGAGTHFVFGTERKLEEAGNENGVSIYDRDLATGVTQVVSTLPNGTTMGGDVGELGISDEGSRVVVGEKTSTDVDGNAYWHLYMHLGTTPNSVDLTPGTTTGVLYSGMSDDGTRVFFATRDQLLPSDTDESADIYESDSSGSGAPVLSIVSRDGTGPSNSDACSPPGAVPWNRPSGIADCSAVAFAGGAGVTPDGTIYFLSPEQLDSGGEVDQPNMYVLRPGGQPQFVATIDTSAGKPLQPPPTRPVNMEFLSGLTNPESLAVDESNGDIYVTENGGVDQISRYTSSGAPHNFSVPGGGNQITGVTLSGASESQIAVDNAPGSPFEGDLYAKKDTGSLAVFAPSGEELGSIEGFNYLCGVAVDQATGDVYVGDYSFGGIRKLEPISGATPVSAADYVETAIETEGIRPCQVGADTSGHVYASRWNSGPLKAFSSADFAIPPPSAAGTQLNASSYAIATDRGNDDLYVTTGTGLKVFGSGGVPKEEFLFGVLTGSHGVAVNAKSHRVYAANGADIVEIGYEEQQAYSPIDNPAVLHAIRQAGVRSSSDFQVTPDGRYAAFPTAAPLTGFDNHGRLEIFRYDSLGKELDCVSCAASKARPPGDASMATDGLSLTDDGHVFFTTPESLVLRDTDEKRDAYEWFEGEARLISSGTSPFDSGLLSASADGHDVFFFTRDSFVDADHNGNLMKIYDARATGGKFVVPDPPPCAASDECHGPGTAVPPPPSIPSLAGSAGNAPAGGCRAGYVKKRGKCIKKKKKANHKRHRRQRR